MTSAAPLTATIVLAAGGSARFGAPKQAAPVDGRPMLTGLLERLTGCAPQPRIVVLGAQAELLDDLVPRSDWSVVINKDWAMGIGSSLQVGLAAAPIAEQVVVVLGDLAWLQAEAIERVVQRAQVSNADVVRAFDGDLPGHPLLMRGAALIAARSQSGGSGMRPLLSELSVDRVECDGLGVARDVDQPGDLLQPEG
ncbi:MAG: nucleotidyltransferase family protein [Actinomycetes bacterium]